MDSSQDYLHLAACMQCAWNEASCRRPASEDARNKKEKLARWKQAAAEGDGLGEELPLVLSTLEDASVTKALSLDSNLSEVVEAVAKGDIKPFSEGKGSRGNVETSTDDLPHDSVGRGPVSQESDPPPSVRPCRPNCNLEEHDNMRLLASKLSAGLFTADLVLCTSC